MRRHVLPTALKDKRQEAEETRSLAVPKTRGDPSPLHRLPSLGLSLPIPDTPWPCSQPLHSTHKYTDFNPGHGSEPCVLGELRNCTSPNVLGAGDRHRQPLSREEGHGDLDKAVTHLGSDPSSTIYHLHNFGKSPKLLVPYFPHLDDKDKSIFPVNKVTLLRPD